MYVSDVISYRPAEINVCECNGSHTLGFSIGTDRMAITMSTEQLIEVAETIEWYLLKKDSDCAECEHNEPEYTPTDRGTIPNHYHCEIDETPEECGK